MTRFYFSIFFLFVCSTSCQERSDIFLRQSYPPSRSLEYYDKHIQNEIVQHRKSHPLPDIIWEGVVEETRPSFLTKSDDEEGAVLPDNYLDPHASQLDLSLVGREEDEEDLEETFPPKPSSLRSPSSINLLAGLSDEEQKIIAAQQAAFDARNKTPEPEEDRPESPDGISQKSFEGLVARQKAPNERKRRKGKADDKKSKYCCIL